MFVHCHLIASFNHPISQAKDSLCQYIDNYIRDRITLADEVIEELAGKKIKDGDVILTYAKWVVSFQLPRQTSLHACRSSVVEKVLLAAREDGKKFSVVVIDSQPLLEGPHHFLASDLSLDLLAQARHSYVPSHVDGTLFRVHMQCFLLFHRFLPKSLWFCLPHMPFILTELCIFAQEL